MALFLDFFKNVNHHFVKQQQSVLNNQFESYVQTYSQFNGSLAPKNDTSALVKLLLKLALVIKALVFADVSFLGAKLPLN